MVANFFYFIIFKKKRKYFIFLGLVLKCNKIRKNFIFTNSIHGQIFKIKINYLSPNLVFIEKSYKYNFFSKKKLFVLGKKPILTNSLYYRTTFISTKKFTEINIYKLIVYNYVGKMSFNLIKKKKFKKIKKKFRY
jgi:hypothetical protein